MNNISYYQRILLLRGRVDGQGMVEFIIAVPILIIIFYAIMYLSDIYVIKFKTKFAARYATWQLAKKDADQAKIKENTINYFFYTKNQLIESKPQVVFRELRSYTHLVEEKLTQVGNDVSRELETQSSGNVDLLTKAYNTGMNALIKYLGKFVFPKDMLTPAAYVQVKTPIKLQIGPVDMKEFGITYLEIVEDHCLKVNDWNGYRIKEHDLLSFVVEKFKDFFSYFTDKGREELKKDSDCLRGTDGDCLEEVDPPKKYKDDRTIP